METLHLSELVRNITPITSILATRFTGKRFWELFEARLSDFNMDDIVFVSFAGVDIMDVSFADEVFARIATMRARKEFSYCYLILSDLNETCEDDLQAALTTRIDREPSDQPNLRNCVLMVQTDDQLKLVGKYENHVRESFSLLMRAKELTARDLAQSLNISLNAASTRLKSIADLGLAHRVEMRDEQGKQYIYHSLL